MATLSIVATPIGNLEDITLRALKIFKEADVILCEDTRVTTKILQKYEINKPLVSYHARSGIMKIERIYDFLEHGKKLALVSDAGTPGISDPGSLLVSHVRKRFGDSVHIEAIPGPSALVAALSVAGVGGSEFTFLGFLPHKKGRETMFREISESKRPIIFYESPHRILKTLASLLQYAPKKKIVIARELTKIYEEILSGTAEELLEMFAIHPNKVRGEFVVIVTPVR